VEHIIVMVPIIIIIIITRLVRIIGIKITGTAELLSSDIWNYSSSVSSFLLEMQAVTEGEV
jgi:hypothetical protein